MFGKAHAHVLNRQYADACEKFKAASVLLSEIQDAQNAAYLQVCTCLCARILVGMCCDDQPALRSLTICMYYTHTHTQTHTHTHTHKRTCIYIYIYVCVCVCVCIYTHTPYIIHLYTCIYVCMHVCMHVCVYVGVCRSCRSMRKQSIRTLTYADVR